MVKISKFVSFVCPVYFEQYVEWHIQLQILIKMSFDKNIFKNEFLIYENSKNEYWNKKLLY